VVAPYLRVELRQELPPERRTYGILKHLTQSKAGVELAWLVTEGEGQACAGEEAARCLLPKDVDSLRRQKVRPTARPAFTSWANFATE
jgi:hypothetical protein